MSEISESSIASTIEGQARQSLAGLCESLMDRSIDIPAHRDRFLRDLARGIARAMVTAIPDPD